MLPRQKAQSTAQPDRDFVYMHLRKLVEKQQFRHLHLIANNTKFVILPGCSVPNLASRVLALSVRRLNEDMRVAHGHLVLLAETFVDRSRPHTEQGSSLRHHPL